MNSPNPYQTPESDVEPLDDGTYRPSGADWLFLIVLLPIACISAFFISCFGSALIMAAAFGPIFRGGDAFVIFAFILGVAAALFVGWFMATRYIRMQRKRYHAKWDLKEEVKEKKSSEFS